MTKPVRGISDDGNRRKETKTDTPPPEFDKERLTVSEIDPDAQSKWKALRQNPTLRRQTESAVQTAVQGAIGTGGSGGTPPARGGTPARRPGGGT